ncbi:armadillo-type protein [Pisolithus orientalis]|uniref:armadillo-type protein n=1 Tax=Pisolithus orientalis TaxID=936130 RepID=UPI0022246822|nr:armadillo-type protein [Pisolithus orientalis]KAI5995298.1 armadillo-type protein [Pisolithus orientalis]
MADDDDHPSHTWQRDRLWDDWQSSMQIAQTILLSSSTKLRLRFIQDELKWLANDQELSLSQTMDVFKLLMQTYPRYIDTQSREAVEELGMLLINKDESRDADCRLGIAEQTVDWLVHEVSSLAKPGIISFYAPADAFVLLSWACGLYIACSKSPPSDSWRKLVGVIAVLVDFQLNPSTHSKPTMQNSALVRTRRALRSAPDRLSMLMSALIAQAKSSQTPLVYIPLLGTAVDVTLRLKNVKDDSLKQITPAIKEDIMALYTSAVLMSKGSVSPHTSNAFHDFIESSVDPIILSSSVLPTMEKALLRSPEYSLSVTRDFFLAYSHPLDIAIFKKLLTSCLSSAKSSNATARANTSALFKVLVNKVPADALGSAVPEILALPQAGKTTGPDHRATLYTMLSMVQPSASVSPFIVKALPPLILKETNDTSITILTSTLPPHLTYLLQSKTDILMETRTSIAKEMTNPKPALRKSFVSIAGNTLWNLASLDTEPAISFVNAIKGSLETNLKSVSANPLGAAAGLLEGYVALAVLLGPLSRSGQFADLVARNTSVEIIAGTPTKPSFLVWEKIYQRLGDVEEETWLLRCVDLVVGHLETELLKNEHLRTQVGSIFLHLAVHSSSFETRRSAIRTLELAVSRHPNLVPLFIRESLLAALTKDKSSTTTSKSVVAVPSPSQPASDDREKPAAVDKQRRYASLLLACAAGLGSGSQTSPFHDQGLGVADSAAFTDPILADFVVLAHHTIISPPSHSLWIEMCQKAGRDPHDLVQRHIDSIMMTVLEASMVDPKLGFADASYRTIGTLAFVCPEVVLPRVMDQLRADIDVQSINALTETDFGIYETPEGTAYTDVLSSNKKEEGPKKGKDADIAKWEAELRQSLASKKGSSQRASSTVTLSKQAAALLQAQLDKEAVVRQRVISLKIHLQRALAFIRSVVSTNAPEARAYVSPISAMLLEGALGQGSKLVGNALFETFIDLARCCSERLDTTRKWVGVAILRALQFPCIPEEFLAEPLHALVLRVLYRLRSISEQSPFDAATFSYAFPLLARVLHQGGIDVSEDEEALEQVALVLDIIRFHSNEFSDTNFPRKDAMESLVHVIKLQPRLSKEASSALVDIGEAILATATYAEISVLIQGTLNQEIHVRNSCLQAIQPLDLTDFDWSPELWIACHDEDEQNARLANHVWEDNGLDVPEDFLGQLLPFLGHVNAYARASSAFAIADAAGHLPQTSEKIIVALQDLYCDKAKILAPEYDEYGMVIPETLNRPDPWPTRVAIASVFEQLAPVFPDTQVEAFIRFLIKDEALGDRSSEVRRGMLQAGTAVVDHHGSAQLTGLLTIFEDHLAAPSTASETSDQTKEAVVILFGRAARHLEASDPRIQGIVGRLVEALKTPAEQVQVAVSDCLVPLVRLMGDRLDTFVGHLFDELFHAPKYAARRGAAYGLAGTIKGLGIGSMKRFDVINRLRTAAEDKKRFEFRQGAMFAFETLSTTLGRLFEPYITFMLPLLLSAFGDGTADVRDAAQDAARVIMGNMSGYGVKLILPSLLSGLDEKQWRSKKGSIELLGMMAYCSPRQLSLSLPIVIPRLTGVLTDTHAQVKASANKSLKQFGEVINNPEIQALVPTLLKALVDPAKTTNALSSLLENVVIPVIERGLRERGAEGKKKAAQIVGNLASLTDSKDFVPYLSTLLPHEARATAAKTLGVLVERLGEVHFPDLVPGLLRTLKAETSGVDRQGAAQGLSEVLSGLGMERLEGLLPDIIANAQSPRSTIREGFMSLLVYLPATIISPILSGLADSEEYVRDAAMRAGRMIVMNYSAKAIDLLLPELEQGMFDPGWRIRQSSIALVGELLFKVSGIKEDAEPVVAESSRRALVEVLGEERRDRILSALYVARQDAVNVALVHNTPRTVRGILPELVSQLIKLYAGGEEEQQETAARTTLELCRKFGEKLVGEIVAILKNMSASPDTRTREGVCLMLSDIMQSTTDTQREGHESEIVSVVRTSLVDDDITVRSAAAKAFDTLQEHIGGKAIDQIIPTLLEALRQPGESSGTALQALREVMSIRASTVFPVLIPTLISTPMTIFNARALASLVTVAGNALSKRLSVILNALVKVFEEDEDEELLGATDEALRALLGSIEDPEGLNTLMMLLLGWTKSDAPRRRASACSFFALFCEESQIDSSLYRVDWIRQLISLFDDPEVVVHTAAWKAFDTFVKSVPKDEYEPLVVALRRTIEGTGAPGRIVPGFSLPKGVAPTVPIIIAGLTTGSNEQREHAAYAIGDLVERTDELVMKSFVVPFTGPLIRVATQATTYPPGVKTAILSALASLLERIPNHVKPFFPQLQRTFVKSVGDPASIVVRTKAAEALGILMRSQPRVDPVVTELINGVHGSEEEIAASYVLALSHVAQNAQAHGGIGEKARESCTELLHRAFRETHDDHHTLAMAGLFVSLSASPESVKPIVSTYLTSGTAPSALSSQSILAVLASDDSNRLDPSETVFAKLGLLRSVALKVKESAANERPIISRPAREARESLKEMAANGEASLAGIF